MKKKLKNFKFRNIKETKYKKQEDFCKLSLKLLRGRRESSKNCPLKQGFLLEFSLC